MEWIFPGGSVGKESSAIQETQEMPVRILGQEDPLEEGMATHSPILFFFPIYFLLVVG